MKNISNDKMYNADGSLKKDVVFEVREGFFSIKDYSKKVSRSLYRSPIYEKLKTVSHIKWNLFVLIDKEGNTKCLDISNNIFYYSFDKKYKQAVSADNKIYLLDFNGSFISVVDLNDYSVSYDYYIEPENPNKYFIMAMSGDDSLFSVCYKLDYQMDQQETQMMFAECTFQNGRIILERPKHLGKGLFDFVSRDMTPEAAFLGLSRIIEFGQSEQS